MRAPIVVCVSVVATCASACGSVFPFPQGIYDVAQTLQENTCGPEMPVFREDQLGVFIKQGGKAAPPSPAPLFVALGYSIAWGEFAEQDESILLNGTINCADGTIGTHQTTSTLSAAARASLTVQTITTFDGAATCEPVAAGCAVTASYALSLAEACDDAETPNSIDNQDWQCDPDA